MRRRLWSNGPAARTATDSSSERNSGLGFPLEYSTLALFELRLSEVPALVQAGETLQG